ncbi:protein kinase C-binding protein NELL2a-like [Oscarella lobularis]|uniref:protein kinase C-binding protein NELL2a-like n=1 Tax=Oscarella lobularis TaxID=121494 RepID=UPI00331332D6
MNSKRTLLHGVLSSGESWIGLYCNGDRFDWTDGTALDYLYWMNGRQGNYTEYNYKKMCVNELGLKNLFRWNGSLCKDCRSYICKKDLDECETGGHNCSKNALCINNDGSFTCQCRYGYVGNGRVCAPNECILRTHNCHRMAKCRDTVAGFTCTCRKRFFGDGRI